MLWWLAMVNEKFALNGLQLSPGILAKSLISSVTPCLNLTSSSLSPCFMLELQPFLSVLPVTLISLTTYVRFLSLLNFVFFFCWAVLIPLSVHFPAFVSMKPLVPLLLVCSRMHVADLHSDFQPYASPTGANVERKRPLSQTKVLVKLSRADVNWDHLKVWNMMRLREMWKLF